MMPFSFQLLEDPLQLRRIKFVIEGPQSLSNQPQDDQIEGMLGRESACNYLIMPKVKVSTK